MSATAAKAISPEKALRRLFLRLFLRGRSSRGLEKEKAPKSIATKLALTLFFYALFGVFAVAFLRQSVFALSVFLHASTMMFVGMFAATSAGEALFNKEEADILMHRPIEPQKLLWAKVSMLAQVALWLAVSYNLAGFFIGASNSPNALLFLAAHALSILLGAFFCISLVVIAYQLCLRWIGREKLDGIVTTAQTLMTVLILVGSQLAPRVLVQQGQSNALSLVMDSWWIFVLPPAWFAGLDDAIAGTGSPRAWVLAALAVGTTTILCWISFGKLAREYAAGLQMLNEAVPKRQTRSGKRPWVQVALNLPPLRWWLRNSVERAAFVLSVAYLLRDREMKLRVYPGLAPMLVMPVIFLAPRGAMNDNGFGLAFAGTYLGMLPMLGLTLLKYSQQWQAADLFRLAPVAGPGPLCHGARKAVFCILTLPLIAILGIMLFVIGPKWAAAKVLLAGLVALPVFALIPCVNGEAVPLSIPSEEAKSAGRGLQMFGVTIAAMALGGLASGAEYFGIFWWFLAAEACAAAALCVFFHWRCRRAVWSPI